MTNWLRRYPVSTGLALMFAFTWPIDLWAAADSRDWTTWSPPPVLVVLVGYGFVVAALVATGLVDGRAGIRALLRRFLVWRVGLLWYAVVLIGPAVLVLIALALHVVSGGATPDFGRPFARQIVGDDSVSLWAVLPLFFAIGVLSNGEEIGWRGYVLPRLQERHSALVSSIVIGLVAALWHLPKFLTVGGPQDFPFGFFLFEAVAQAILYTWVYNSTGRSLLLVTLLHASSNTATVFLPILPAATGDSTALLISFGVHCAVAAAVVLVAGPARLSRATTGGPAGPAHPKATWPSQKSSNV
jgi:uncharacterized protein